MEVRQKSVGSVQKGDWVVIENVPCKVTNVQISKPGKHGHAKVRIEAITLDGKRKSIVAPGHDNIDTPVIEKKVAQILSIQGDSANVMDTETFETFDLEIPEELKGKISEGMNVLYWKILDKKIM